MKKQSNLSRLLQIAGNHKYLTYASWVLSAISALIALVPFYYIWKVMQEVLAVAPDFSHAQNLTRNGWMAVLFAALHGSLQAKAYALGMGLLFGWAADRSGSLLPGILLHILNNGAVLARCLAERGTP